MGKGTWKRLLLVTAVLLGFSALMTRAPGQPWDNYVILDTAPRLYQGEVVAVYPKYHQLLVADFEEDRGASLFSCNIPENFSDMEKLRPGILVDIIGPPSMKITFPAQLDHVEQVEITGERPDFIAKYLDSLEAEYGDKDREERWAAVRALEDLNNQEKRGLWYMLECRDLE